MGAACLESNSAAAWYICKAARPSRLSVAAVGPGAGVVDDMVLHDVFVFNDPAGQRAKRGHTTSIFQPDSGPGERNVKKSRMKYPGVPFLPPQNGTGVTTNDGVSVSEGTGRAEGK